MANDSYYPAGGDDADDGSTPATSTDQPAQNDSPSEDKDEASPKEDGGGDTALMPASAFGGDKPQPGQKCTFEVVHCYEDECEVRYVDSNAKDDAAGDSDEMKGAMGKLSAMAG